MQWYVSQNGKTTGPFDEERLVMLARWGKISPAAFVCDAQLSAWLPIRRTSFAALLADDARDGASADAAAAPESAAQAEGRGAKQALGLVAFSVILAGVLMAAL